MKDFVDYYKLLGLKRDADETAIKKAYRRAAIKYHPDRNADRPAEEQEALKQRMQLVNEAYEVLSNRLKKIGYDFQYNQVKRREALVDAYREDNPNIRRQDDEDYSSVWPKSSRTSPVEEQIKNMQPKYTELDEEKLMAISRRRYERPERQEPSVGDYVLRISKKFIKELNKLKLRKNDNAVRYVLRNKKIITGVLVLAIGAGVIAKNSADNKDDLDIISTNPTIETQIDETTSTELPYEITESTETTEATEAVEESIVLYRVHRIVQGDILSRFSAESNTTMDEIKRVNGMKSNNVILGTDLIIPYIIDPEDLDLYTTPASYNPNMTLEEYAKSYETDIDTLMKINPEAIEFNGTYTVSSDSLLVPNFITYDEYKTLKAAERITENQKVNK